MTKTITGLSGTEAKDDGRTIEWVFDLEGGEQQTFRCPQELLSMILQGLRLGGEIAAKVRRGNPPVKNGIFYGHRATGVQTARAQDGQVVLRYSTEPGLPVEISMPPHVATDTVEQIGQALAAPAQSPFARN